MKKSVLFMALMAVTMTAGAQRNDLYSSGKNSGKSSSQSTQGSAVVTRTPSYTEPEVTYQQAAPVVKTTPQIIVDRDPDEYNRRYTYGTSQIQYEDGSILDDVPTVYIHDTIYVIDPESGEKRYVYDDDGSYAEGYNDAVEDYYLTRRLYRFRHYGRFYHSLYDDLLWDIVYWDRYFDDRYWYYSHTYYYDPWYYDPWYYDPWYYGGWRYTSWYYDPYYHYGPVYYYSGPVVVNDRTTYYTPNRSVNGGGWDRNLSRTVSGRTAAFGSSNNRSVSSASGVASRSVTTNATPDRSVAGSASSRSVSASASSRSVGNSNSSSSRSVAGSSSSRSVSSSSSRSTTSSSTVRSVAPATSSRSSSTSSSRSVSSSSSSRSTQSGTTYDRPSSTSTSRSVSSSSSSTSRSVGSSSSSSSFSSGGSSSSSSSFSSGSSGSRAVSGSSSRR